MTELKTVYRLKDDKTRIGILQSASSDSDSSYGLKIQNGLLVGTREWFNAIDSGQIKSVTLHGTITKVFMSGHNDYPEFEVESMGQKTSWTRYGQDEFYKPGKKIELRVVQQKFKRGQTTDLSIEIKIEK
jgi:hypothetical protein